MNKHSYQSWCLVSAIEINKAIEETQSFAGSRRDVSLDRLFRRNNIKTLFLNLIGYKSINGKKITQ